MPFIFSAAAQLGREEIASPPLELQMLSEDDLMDVWEQTQRAIHVLQEKGWDASAAINYAEVLVWEMQRRLIRLPLGRRFGEEPLSNEESQGDFTGAFPQFVALRI